VVIDLVICLAGVKWLRFGSVVTYLLLGRGDHDPKHVHVFKNNQEVLKWNIEASAVMTGKINAKLRKLIDQLVKEKKL
jgi:hypothetical protein